MFNISRDYSGKALCRRALKFSANIFMEQWIKKGLKFQLRKLVHARVHKNESAISESIF
jgi:hypothetical protein